MAAFTVTDRRGCDLHPVDAASPEGRLLLTSFVWPFDVHRHQRLAGGAARGRRASGPGRPGRRGGLAGGRAGTTGGRSTPRGLALDHPALLADGRGRRRQRDPERLRGRPRWPGWPWSSAPASTRRPSPSCGPRSGSRGSRRGTAGWARPTTTGHQSAWNAAEASGGAIALALLGVQQLGQRGVEVVSVLGLSSGSAETKPSGSSRSAEVGTRSGWDQTASRPSVPRASRSAAHRLAASRIRRGRSSRPTRVANVASAGPPVARARRTVSASAAAAASAARWPGPPPRPPSPRPGPAWSPAAPEPPSAPGSAAARTGPPSRVELSSARLVGSI